MLQTCAAAGNRVSYPEELRIVGRHAAMIAGFLDGLWHDHLPYLLVIHEWNTTPAGYEIGEKASSSQRCIRCCSRSRSSCSFLRGSFARALLGKTDSTAGSRDDRERAGLIIASRKSAFHSIG